MCQLCQLAYKTEVLKGYALDKPGFNNVIKLVKAHHCHSLIAVSSRRLSVFFAFEKKSFENLMILVECLSVLNRAF